MVQTSLDAGKLGALLQQARERRDQHNLELAASDGFNGATMPMQAFQHPDPNMGMMDVMTEGMLQAGATKTKGFPGGADLSPSLQGLRRASPRVK